MQMRTVSKSWNGLLSDPSFVKSHLHRSIHNNNQQVLLVSSSNFKPFKQYLCKLPYLEPVNFIKDIPTNLPIRRVIGAVNGLICLSEYGYSNIHIWNPSISAMSAIPPPHSLAPFQSCTLRNTYVSTSIRFGFDPKTNDYKLVKISGTLRDIRAYGVSVKEWLGVEVYNMRKGSWEYITQPFPSHVTRIYDPDYTCVDGHHGHLHWGNGTDLWRERTIVGFDLGSETFYEMPFPDAILDSIHGTHLRVLGVKLCVIFWRMRTSYEVWVMEEYGVHESWVKCNVYGFPYGFTSRSELICRDKNGRLVLYDPITNKTISTRSAQPVRKIVEYVDSLVWI